MVEVRYWPYVIPLPVRKENRLRFLLKVFGSDVAVSILELTPLEGKIAQKELIEKLPYSNKTVISHLNSLVSMGVLRESMEKVVRSGRRVWVKYYSLSEVGRWITLLIGPKEPVKRKLLEHVVRESFRLYVKSLIDLCKKYELRADHLLGMVDEELKRLKSGG